MFLCIEYFHIPSPKYPPKLGVNFYCSVSPTWASHFGHRFYTLSGAFRFKAICRFLSTQNHLIAQQLRHWSSHHSRSLSPHLFVFVFVFLSLYLSPIRSRSYSISVCFLFLSCYPRYCRFSVVLPKHQHLNQWRWHQQSITLISVMISISMISVSPRHSWICHLDNNLLHCYLSL